ncbi:MAG: transcription-repair coupling factor [Planctomycetes bacterium]|nr:transcription-repair coupling factor [Planctomycetota bacterium]
MVSSPLPPVSPDLLEAAASALSVQRIAARLGAGASVTAGGVWGSSYALILGALSRTIRPSILVVPTLAEWESAAADLAAFQRLVLATFPEADASPQAYADRLRTAQRIAAGELTFAVASARAFLQELPSPAAMERARVRWAVGNLLDPDALSLRLIESRYERTHAVERPGEYAIRGGIVDLFPFTSEHPVRVELVGRTIESIRAFRVSDQSSTEPLPSVEFSLVPLSEDGRSSSALTEYLPAGGWIALREPADIREEGLPQALAGHPVLTLQSLPLPEVGATVNVKTRSMQRFSGVLSNVAGELAAVAKDRDRLFLFSANEGEEDRLRQLLHDARANVQGLEFRRGRLTTGFDFEEIRIACLSNHELFNRYRIRRPAERVAETRPITELLELQRGDTVVHLMHGIGRFLGIETLQREGRRQDFVALEYQGGAKVYVPVANIDLIQKYVGGTETPPPVHALGGSAWSAAKLRAEEAVRRLARDLLQVQALRETERGIAYPPDSEWQREFEASFPYEDTEDQLEVTRALKRDMESSQPMDRLVCGDVGYGKTELAMRAAFKAATSNQQVAVLVPTTVLAQQHYQTFRERMADYPLSIEVISRFKSKAEQRRVLKATGEGTIDILIGTHRLAQEDVKFKDLGLVIIDEEQRFGVEHKERLKRLRATVDVLTLTATPIPRTMHMALLGIRDISTLATPPQDRLAIRTEVIPYDERRIREAIVAELDRGGQVYFVHNRVHSIEEARRHLEMLVPEATFGVGHGQMDEDELEWTMIAFLERKIDVLVATTIIESGLDIPNVNTILIDNADQFGLADLHQLRGRVGRYKVQAQCLLLLPRDRPIVPQARKRLKAIEEFSELGSGFKIAMRDLEIRGVGNLLGREQHGHISAVGYDLYVKMLERETKRLKLEDVEDLPETSVELGIDAGIPAEYIEDIRSRVEAYRLVVGSEDPGAARARLADRYGPPPAPVENFLNVVRVKQLARRWRLTSVAKGKAFVAATYLSRRAVEQLSKRSPREIRIVDEKEIHIYPNGDPAGPALAEALIRLLAP